MTTFRVEADWPGGGFGYSLPFNDEAQARAWAEHKARVHPDAVIEIAPREDDAVRAAGMGAVGILGDIEDDDPGDNRCMRCGRGGHTSDECHAKLPAWPDLTRAVDARRGSQR